MGTKTPAAPYYAVIFSSTRTAGGNGYGKMSARMEELAAAQEGFLGIESARDTDGFGITVSYWTSLEAIKTWKEHAEHKVAQELGKTEWYEDFTVRISKVERDYSFDKD